MNQVIDYLQSKSLPDELILLAGTTDSTELIRNVLQMRSLNYVSIYVPTHQMETRIRQELKQMQKNMGNSLPDIINVKGYTELEQHVAYTDKCTVLFDFIPSSELLDPFIGMSPQYLVGTCAVSDISSFELWEKSRLSVKNMYLLSLWESGKTEELVWEDDGNYAVELSVIFPMYRVADYLPQCIESCIAWDAEYVEYLFVDDGSPDNCAEIVLEYAKRDSRIKLIRKENGGCASARQKGLECAKGRYIGFIDPDDYIDPDMFRKLFMRALIGSYEIAYCGFYRCYEDSGKIVADTEALGTPYQEGTSDTDLICKLITQLSPAIWRKIHHANLISREGIHFYTDVRLADDLPFHVETISRAKSVVAVPECLYYYRLARPGQDALIDDERLFAYFKIFRYLDAFFSRSSDKHQLGELQLKKLDVHINMLRKIQKKYFKAYCKRAKADIRKNFRLMEGIRAIRQHGSKMKVILYLMLYFGNRPMIRSLFFCWDVRKRIRRH